MALTKKLGTKRGQGWERPLGRQGREMTLVDFLCQYHLGAAAQKAGGTRMEMGTLGCWGQAGTESSCLKREPSQEPSPALLHHGLLYSQQCGYSQGEPGQLPPTLAKGLTCQLSQFGAATAMGHSWKPPEWGDPMFELWPAMKHCPWLQGGQPGMGQGRGAHAQPKNQEHVGPSSLCSTTDTPGRNHTQTRQVRCCFHAAPPARLPQLQLLGALLPSRSH